VLWATKTWNGLRAPIDLFCQIQITRETRAALSRPARSQSRGIIGHHVLPAGLCAPASSLFLPAPGR
jgi:hypothetical protein